MPQRQDFIVVGAGILGLAVARELRARHPGAQITVLEQADAVGAHQTGHNSGVIHAGVYYAPGSLKARLCVEGAVKMYAYCAEHGIDARPIGKLIIATSREELPALDELERRARSNAVPGIRRLVAAEIPEIEPNATGVAALHSPHTGIVDFGEVCRALAGTLREQGVEIRLGSPVLSTSLVAGGIRAELGGGEALDADLLVSCAGLWSDRLAVRAGAPADPRIVPFRGGYLRLKQDRRHLIRGLIYPVPDPALPFLGIHFTPRVDGEILAGPTALLVASRTAYRAGTVTFRDLRDTLAWPGSWRMGRQWWRVGLKELRYAISPRVFASEASRYVPAVRPEDFEPAFGGVRAQAVGRDGKLVDDFVISNTERALHVRNAPSPAATSSLALAGYIADEVERARR